MQRVLLLNASYEPLNFISDKKAIRLLIKDKAEIFLNLKGFQSTWPDLKFASPSTDFDVPATLRLVKRVNNRRRVPRFGKKILFNRDSWMCQYCSTHLQWNTITIDHVIPKSHGGPTSWANCVAACRHCNKIKANRTPDQANMKLVKSPKTPSALHFWDVSRKSLWHDDWDYFVPLEHQSS